MAQKRGRPRAAIGFTVKSGWASVVLLVGSAAALRVADSCRVELSDPAIAESRQPYHEGFATAREAGRDLSRLVGAVRRFGRRSVTELIRRYRAAGHPVRRAGIVVGSLIDPERIANDHIRIHALEGQLFRVVVRDAAARSRVSCSIWRDRDLQATACRLLKLRETVLRGRLTDLGRDVDGPWRVEQKSAALAAWLVLAVRQPRGRRAAR